MPSVFAKSNVSEISSSILVNIQSKNPLNFLVNMIYIQYIFDLSVMIILKNQEKKTDKIKLRHE